MGIEDRLDRLVDLCVRKVSSGGVRSCYHVLHETLEGFVDGRVSARDLASYIQPLLSESGVESRRSPGSKLYCGLACANVVSAGVQLYGGLAAGAVLSGFLAAYFCYLYKVGGVSYSASPAKVYSRDDVELVLESKRSDIEGMLVRVSPRRF